MSILEIILYAVISIAMLIWLIVIIVKWRKLRKRKKMGIEEDEECDED